MPRIQNWVQYCDFFFFFVMIFREPPQKHQKIYGLLRQNGPHKSYWRKTEPVSNLPFSDISNSQESKTRRNMRFFASKYMYWCMFTYLDIAWNYKVTKINQIINQNRWTPSIRHQSGLNPLLVFSMPMDVFPLLISLQRNMHPHFVSCCWDNANGQINLYHRDSIKDLLILVLNPVGWFLPSFILKFSKNGTSQPSILYLKVNLIFSTTHQTRVSCTFRCKKKLCIVHPFKHIFFFILILFW